MQTPRFIKRGKRAYYIAIDLTLIPYHGEHYMDEKEIVRSQPKSGTTHFHGYATVSPAHEAQAHHYLAATGMKLAIILNFGTQSLGQKRIVR